MLSFSLSGDGEIDLMLVAKKPGPALITEEARAAIPLAGLDGADPLPPYVRLIHDVHHRRPVAVHPAGRAGRGVEGGRPAAEQPAEAVPYPQGSWGPGQARNLIAPDHWLLGQ